MFPVSHLAHERGVVFCPMGSLLEEAQGQLRVEGGLGAAEHSWSIPSMAGTTGSRSFSPSFAGFLITTGAATSWCADFPHDHHSAPFGVACYHFVVGILRWLPGSREQTNKWMICHDGLDMFDGLLISLETPLDLRVLYRCRPPPFFPPSPSPSPQRACQGGGFQVLFLSGFKSAQAWTYKQEV